MLFAFFQDRPELPDQPVFQKAILGHLPAFVQNKAGFRGRIKTLPPKIKYAILASEIASAIVYRGGWEPQFENRLKAYLKEQYA
jgi:glutamate dehydrogenase